MTYPYSKLLNVFYLKHAKSDTGQDNDHKILIRGTHFATEEAVFKQNFYVGHILKYAKFKLMQTPIVSVSPPLATCQHACVIVIKWKHYSHC